MRLIPDAGGRPRSGASSRSAIQRPGRRGPRRCSATGTSSTGSTRGFAAHHAGMLPTFREIVEELFTAGRIRAVFATETLALGINMPARTVVLEQLVKFNGETHADITPAEYTQLTGRAGRRGIDVEGHAVVLWNRGLDPLAVGRARVDPHLPAALELPARPTTWPSTSCAQVGRETRPRDPRDLVRAVPGRPGRRRLGRHGPAQRGGARGLRRGDDVPPRRLRRVRRDARRDPRPREGRRPRRGRPVGRGRGRASAWRSCGSATSSGSRPAAAPGYAVVVQANRGGKGEAAAPDRRHRGPAAAPADPGRRADPGRADRPRARAQALQRQEPQVAPRPRRDRCGSTVPHDPPPQPRARGRRERRRDDRIDRAAPPAAGAPLPPVPRPRGPRPLGRALVAAAARDRRAAAQGRRPHQLGRPDLRPDLRPARPRWATSADGGTAVTPRGSTLRRLYTEKDLLAAECLRARRLAPARRRRARRGRLDAGPRAAPRGGRASPRGCPATTSREALRPRWSGSGASSRTASATSRCRVTGEPDGGMAWMMHRWASGQRLEAVLRGQRHGRRRLRAPVQADRRPARPDRRRGAASRPLAATARKAVDAVLRGVVAADRARLSRSLAPGRQAMARPSGSGHVARAPSDRPSHPVDAGRGSGR